MTNIVERLRRPILTAEFIGGPTSGTSRAVLSEDHAKADMLEAANEIERLRKENLRLRTPR